MHHNYLSIHIILGYFFLSPDFLSYSGQQCPEIEWLLLSSFLTPWLLSLCLGERWLHERENWGTTECVSRIRCSAQDRAQGVS